VPLAVVALYVELEDWPLIHFSCFSMFEEASDVLGLLDICLLLL